jgi:hypothetical protein
VRTPPIATASMKRSSFFLRTAMNAAPKHTAPTDAIFGAQPPPARADRWAAAKGGAARRSAAE